MMVRGVMGPVLAWRPSGLCVIWKFIEAPEEEEETLKAEKTTPGPML
jgi:hypothetical protein